MCWVHVSFLAWAFSILVPRTRHVGVRKLRGWQGMEQLVPHPFHAGERAHPPTVCTSTQARDRRPQQGRDLAGSSPPRTLPLPGSSLSILFLAHSKWNHQMERRLCEALSVLVALGLMPPGYQPGGLRQTSGPHHGSVLAAIPLGQTYFPLCLTRALQDRRYDRYLRVHWKTQHAMQM